MFFQLVVRRLTSALVSDGFKNPNQEEFVSELRTKELNYLLHLGKNEDSFGMMCFGPTGCGKHVRCMSPFLCMRLCTREIGVAQSPVCAMGRRQYIRELSRQIGGMRNHSAPNCLPKVGPPVARPIVGKGLSHGRELEGYFV